MSIKINGANGVRINVEDIGIASGRPVVFIHGWALNHNMFEYQYTELPKHGYRCIGIDLRGFGDSDKPWDGYNYNTMADDIKSVLDILDLQDATLVGFSMGGPISIRYTSRHHQAHIKNLVLLAAAAPCLTKREDFPYGTDKAAVDDLIRQTYKDRPSMLRNFTEVLFESPEKLSPEIKMWNMSLGLTASAYATIQCAIETRDADLRRDLDNIHVPTLILHGVNDRVCSFDLAKALHGGIKGSQLVPIEGAGHGLYFEERDRVNSELVKFIG